MKISLFSFSHCIVLAILGNMIGSPLLVSAGTMQNSLECKRKLGAAPRNPDAKIDWVERRIACWKDQQDNAREDKISNIPTTTQLPERSPNEEFELGRQYYQAAKKGKGVFKDYSKAKTFFEIGANAGHAESQSLLGALYYYGHGVLRDYDIAFGWFRLAALQGDQAARKKIAYMYEHGLGVPQDLEKANELYKISTHDLNRTITLSDSLVTPPQPMGAIRSATQKEGYARKNREFSLGYSLAYRHDQLEWNEAGNMSGCCPDVQSELSWKDLDIAQLAIDANGRMNDFYYRGRFGYGAILDGNVSDTDFGANGRSNITSLMKGEADRGYVLDAKFGIGLSLYNLQGLEIISMLGYNYSKQKLSLHEPAGYHIGGGGGAASGLNSTYSARWMGPWIGLDFLMEKSKNWNIAMGFEYHLADYYAEANWNLRNDFAHPKSFEHFNNGMAGRGILGYLNLRYRLSQNWHGTLMTEFQKWDVDGGTSRAFLANGNTADVKLNEVNWKSFTTRFGISYDF